MICELCKVKYADKKNSHIIPKFLGKGLFADTAPRHSISISKEGKQKKNKILQKKIIYYVVLVKVE